MGFQSSELSWAELEARLSNGRAPSSVAWNAGGDGPALSAKRQPFQPVLTPQRGEVPYAELHCRSNFSFLEGAAHPEELAEVAASLGLYALGLTDRNGLYGIVRFAEAARAVSLPTAFGVELDCGARGDVVLLARGPSGYSYMARAISEGQLAGAKGAPLFSVEHVARTVRNHCIVLTGDSRGSVVRALMNSGPRAAENELQELIEHFGRDNVFVELWDHGDPIDTVRNDQLVHIAHRLDVECVATNNVSCLLYTSDAADD